MANALNNAPAPIPPGYGRVYNNGTYYAVKCSCPRPVSLPKDPSFAVLWCATIRGGCGAEWDYQTVQAATLGTDLPSKQTQTAPVLTAPIVKPYARKAQDPALFPYLECHCGRGVQALVPGAAMPSVWECVCGFRWDDFEVNKAQIGDLVPGTSIANANNSPHPPSIPTGSIYTGWGGGAARNYYAPPATPPVMFDAPVRPEPKSDKKLCLHCGGEWCEYLDAYYGESTLGKELCVSCRKKAWIV